MSSSVIRRPRKFSNESQEILSKIINTPNYNQKKKGANNTPLTDDKKEAVRITQNINSAIYYHKNKCKIKVKNLLKRYTFTDEQLKEYETKEDWNEKWIYLLIQSKTTF